MSRDLKKYMTEYQIHSFSTRMNVMYVEDSEGFFEQGMHEGIRYHIYMITKIPKLRFINESLIINEKSVLVEIESFQSTTNSTYSIEIPKSFIPFEINKASINDTRKRLTFYDDNGGGVILPALIAFNSYCNDILDHEVFYIGKAYGRDGRHSAIKDRLSKHETLQKILLDDLNNTEDRDNALILWEFQPRLRTIHDGITKNYIATEKEEQERFLKLMSNPPFYISDQLINLTEAALINFFKPKYNTDFINNFPKINHTGYKYYYDLDFQAIIVELDPFPINARVFSENKFYDWRKAIRYKLTEEEERRLLFGRI